MTRIDGDSIKKWMDKKPRTTDQNAAIRKVFRLFAETGRTELPVIEEGRLAGVIKLRNCLDSLEAGTNWDAPIADLVERAGYPAGDDLSLMEMADRPFYIVNDKSGALEGVIGAEQLLALAVDQSQALKKLNTEADWFKLCFDTAYEGLAVVDDKGIIRMFNETYSRYVGITKEKAIGRPVERVIEDTRLPVVLKTGVPERNQAHRLQGQDLIVHRMPLWKNGQVVGAVGMLIYEGVSEIYKALERMAQLKDSGRTDEFLHDAMQKVPEKTVRFEDIIGESPAISHAKKIARKAAQSSATVLISGESGVGKEQFARAIHDMGNTKKGNFISINCAAIPENLLESELFGYTEGAFTGARRNGKPGKLELAHNGTLFLDEIGDMPLFMQVKMLRVLQEKEVERIGAMKPVPVHFRLIAATNKNLKQMVARGEFREDLYYRLNVIPLHIPPLRDRKQDIPLIIADVLPRLCKLYNMSEKTVDKSVLHHMFSYDWPGNVRELINILERLFVLTSEPHIHIKDLPKDFFADFQRQRTAAPRLHLLNGQIEAVRSHAEEEKRLIEETLAQVNGNKSMAARLLGISRATLYNKLSRFKAAGK